MYEALNLFQPVLQKMLLETILPVMMFVSLILQRPVIFMKTYGGCCIILAIYIYIHAII